jgi:hypothetical protein
MMLSERKYPSFSEKLSMIWENWVAEMRFWEESRATARPMDKTAAAIKPTRWSLIRIFMISTMHYYPDIVNDQ